MEFVFAILFIAYNILYYQLNKIFKAVKHEVSQILMILPCTIWISLWGLVVLFQLFTFWFKHSDFRVDTSPLPYYPKVTIVVPTHNEDVVVHRRQKLS